MPTEKQKLLWVMNESISIYLNTNRKLLLFLYDYDVQFNYTNSGDKIIKNNLSLSPYSVIVLAVLSPRRAELAKHLFSLSQFPIQLPWSLSSFHYGGSQNGLWAGEVNCWHRKYCLSCWCDDLRCQKECW